MSSSKMMWTEELLKYVAEKTAESTSLESWIHWTKQFLDEHKDCRYTPNTLIGYAQTALKTNEDLPYLDIMQKVQLWFVFSQKVSEKFEKMLLDQRCKIILDSRRRMEYFQSADGSFERSANHLNHLGRKPNKKDPQPSVQQTNGQSSSAAGEPRAENVGTRQNQHQGDHLPTNIDERAMEEKPDVFDSSAREYQEPTTSTKRRQGAIPTEAKRSKQDDNGAGGLMRNSRTSLENFERRPMTSTSLRPETATSSSSHSSTPRVTPTPSEASMTSVNASSSVKAPKQDSFTQTCSVLSVTSTPAPKTDPSHEIKSISSLRLAEQIEALAETFGFSELENKAARIQSRVEDRNKMIKLNKFNVYLIGVLITLEGEAVEYCDGESMLLKTLFKRIRNFLLRPLGNEIVTKPLELINKKIENLDKEDSKGVVPMDLIKENLELIFELQN